MNERTNERKKERKKEKKERKQKHEKKYVYKQNKGATKSARILKVFITTYIVVKDEF